MPRNDASFLAYDTLFFDRYTGKALSVEATGTAETLLTVTDSSDEIKSALIDFNGHTVSISIKCNYKQTVTEDYVAHASDTYTIDCDDPEYDGLCAMMHPTNIDLLNKINAGEVHDVEDVLSVVPVQATIDLSKDYSPVTDASER